LVSQAAFFIELNSSEVAGMKRSNRIDRNDYIVGGSQKKVSSVPLTNPRFTTGKISQDRVVFEPVRDGANSERLALLSWDGVKATIKSRISCDAELYAPAWIDPTILHGLTLPTQIAPYGSARKLLTDIAGLMAEYSRLSEKSVEAVSRWALSSWFPEITPAPDLSIVGPDTAAGRQLMRLLHSFCRRPLLLTDVNEAGLRSLPTEWSLCLLIVQRELSAGLQQILSSAKSSIGFVPRGGRLLDFHCTVATYSEPGGVCSSEVIPGLEISVIPVNQGLLVLDTAMQQQIADDFQPKLLHYRLPPHSGQESALSYLD
jgi:hypothetical protein